MPEDDGCRASADGSLDRKEVIAMCDKKKTKIFCTMGPACWDVETVTDLIDAGLNVCRFNFSHGDHSAHQECLERVRKATANRPDRNIAILLDTKGPEIRTGNFVKDKAKMNLKAGQDLILTSDYSYEATDDTKLAITYEKMATTVKPGDSILCADGTLVLSVKECYPDKKEVLVKVMNDQSIGMKKNMNLPGVKVELPVLQDKDINDLQNFAVPNKVDFIAASFVQCADDIHYIREILGEGGKDIKIISKIENQEGLINFDSILEVTDGVMVARGDLGMEIPPEQVFKEQKMMVEKCRAVGKPCLVATQMLESMIMNPRPTRAECGDVANAVLDGCDSVMLSGETANGAFPRDAVGIMAEKDPSGLEQIFDLMEKTKLSKSKLSPIESAASCAVKMAADVGAKAILVLSKTGETARFVAKYHPQARIMCGVDAGDAEKSGHIARVIEGFMNNATAIVCDTGSPNMDMYKALFAAGKKKHIFSSGDNVVALHTVKNEDDEKQWTIKLMTVH